MLVVAVTFTIHEAHRDEFRRAILENAATSVQEEEGCLMFDVCETTERPLFFLYEKYADEKAFQHHLASPHFLAFDRASLSWVKDKKVERFSLLSDPTKG